MKNVLLIFLVLSASLLFAQSEHPAASAKVNWLTFEQAVEKSKTEKRKLFVDVYTDWCGWCKVMDKNTFAEPTIAKLLNEKFYPVKFNAEQREDVVFQGTTFKFIQQGNSGAHQLAVVLLNNQLSYPTVAFVEEDFSNKYPVPGYRKPEEFHPLLIFFLENFHKKSQEEQAGFSKIYKSPYTATPVKQEGSGH
ncbi:MAG: thioredoxin family protein [Flammeovirgaceae bacterium]